MRFYLGVIPRVTLTGQKYPSKLQTVKTTAQGHEANAERNLFSYYLFLPICPRSLLCLWQLEGFHRGCRIHVQAPHEDLQLRRKVCAPPGVGLARQEKTATQAAQRVGKTLSISGSAKDWWEIKNLSSWISNKHLLAPSQHLCWRSDMPTAANY